jgi:IS5 family transposase
MQAVTKSRLLRFVEQAYHLARRAVARYSSKFSKRRYTLHQHIVLLCLKVRKNTTYRTLLDELIEIPRIRSAIDHEELPSPSTLCKPFTRLHMAVWRVLLNLSVTLLPANGVVGIDASGFDRTHASKHYTKGTKLTIQRLKVTLLVDTGSNAIIDVHVTTTRKHDSKIAPSLIKHREFSSLLMAWNARLDADLYGQRSQNETVSSRLKRKYGAFVRSRHWWKQFRELVVDCLTHNIDKTL